MSEGGEGLGRASEEGKALLEECRAVRDQLLAELPQDFLAAKVQQQLLELVEQVKGEGVMGLYVTHIDVMIPYHNQFIILLFVLF